MEDSSSSRPFHSYPPRPRYLTDVAMKIYDFAKNSDFVHSMMSLPRLMIIMYNPAIMQIFKSTLQTEYDAISQPAQQMTYDTFKLTDMYLSVLQFRATQFDPSPQIPLAFFLHDLKLKDAHDELFRNFARTACPELSTAQNVVVVTASEPAVASIAEHFPSLQTSLRTNHLLQGAQTWLQEWKTSPMDVAAVEMYRLSKFHVNEISRGHRGLGNYRLRRARTQTTSPAATVAASESMPSGSASSALASPAASNATQQSRGKRKQVNKTLDCKQL